MLAIGPQAEHLTQTVSLLSFPLRSRHDGHPTVCERTCRMSVAQNNNSPAQPSSTAITLQIVSIVFYTFIAFLCIGLPIAVLPGYIHDQLGFSALIAGLAIASQYLATLLSRPFAGRATDSLGSKRAIVFGLTGIVISGALTL
ncbi:MAG: transporter, partial [Pseudomonas sp.]|nr:transporter [Pseudomonas sp.]